MNILTLTSLLALCLLLNSCSSHNPSNITQQQLDDYESQLVVLKKKYNVPGLAVGISQQDSLIFSKGFGYADIDNQIEVTPETPFRIASLTKPIASTIMMKLAEEKRIDLSWKIKDHYPDYLGSCERILGYFENDMPEYAFLLNEYQPTRSDITLRHHLSHTAENTPGDKYKYNGFLFGMLSDVMASVTGTPFDSLMREIVIDKLDLNHTLPSQLDSSKPDVLKSLAKPYIIKGKDEFELGEFPNPKLNAGAGLISSVTDLMKFDDAVDQNVLIGKKSKEEQFTPYMLNDGNLSPYGLGWFSQKYKGYTLIWHYGWQPDAYSGLYLKILEKDVTLILLANSEGLSNSFELGKGNVLTSDFARAFLELLFKE